MILVFLKDEKTLVSKINLFENSDDCYQLDHHYAHALSSFPVIDTNNHYVNDGHGDWHKYLSVIKKDKLNDYLVEVFMVIRLGVYFKIL